ncbi:zinc finger protein 16-like [Artemia franciscana]|uniref:zinc finger protein 16-like n=1 Tax=Artemia franciscana TaxID=6661 RepID=UPI0032DA7EDA
MASIDKVEAPQELKAEIVICVRITQLFCAFYDRVRNLISQRMLHPDAGLIPNTQSESYFCHLFFEPQIPTQQQLSSRGRNTIVKTLILDSLGDFNAYTGTSTEVENIQVDLGNPCLSGMESMVEWYGRNGCPKEFNEQYFPSNIHEPFDTPNLVSMPKDENSPCDVSEKLKPDPGHILLASAMLEDEDLDAASLSDSSQFVQEDEKPHILDYVSVHISEEIESVFEPTATQFVNLPPTNDQSTEKLGLYVCNVCKKSFPLKSLLSRHRRIHPDGKPYHCEVCKKKFALRAHLTEHMRSHSGEKPFGCEICQKRFSIKSNLTNHVLIHSGDKPYNCELCTKGFPRKCDLVCHMRVHSGEKPYACEICHKGFSTRSYLNTHLKTHSGVRPHACEVCKKSFSRRCDLNKHLTIHSGERPYKCDICKKSFSAKSTLTGHMITHSREKPYGCGLCRKGFSRKSDLTKHLRTHV